MNFNDLDPNEKFAMILLNRQNIKRMRDDFIAITVLITLFGLGLVGMVFALYEIKSQLGINIFSLGGYMRKIEKFMLAAIKSHHSFEYGNTTVSVDFNTAHVFLHGNHIVSVVQNGKVIVNKDTLRVISYPIRLSRDYVP